MVTKKASKISTTVKNSNREHSHEVGTALVHRSLGQPCVHIPSDPRIVHRPPIILTEETGGSGRISPFLSWGCNGCANPPRFHAHLPPINSALMIQRADGDCIVPASEATYLRYRMAVLIESDHCSTIIVACLQRRLGPDIEVASYCRGATAPSSSLATY